jgi:hypothetical protein
MGREQSDVSYPVSVSEIIRMALPPSDFGKKMAETYRGIKDTFEKAQSAQSSDKSIREEVAADLDRLIEKNEKR